MDKMPIYRVTIETPDKRFADSLTYVAQNGCVHSQVVAKQEVSEEVDTASVSSPVDVETRTVQDPTPDPSKEEPAKAKEPTHTLTELRELMNAIWSTKDKDKQAAVAKIAKGYTTDGSMRPQAVPDDKRDEMYTQLESIK